MRLYSGDLTIDITYSNKLDTYQATVSQSDRRLWSGQVSPREAYLTADDARDSPEAYERVAAKALYLASREMKDIGDAVAFKKDRVGVLFQRMPPGKTRNHATRRTPPAQLQREINAALRRHR